MANYVVVHRPRRYAVTRQASGGRTVARFGLLGPTGPNAVTATTTTTLTGLLKGDGSVVSAVTTSAGLAAVLSDETGTGVVVYSVSPTVTTPIVTGTLTVEAAGGSAVNRVQVSQSGAVTSVTVAATAGSGQQLQVVCRDRTYTFTDGTGGGFSNPTSQMQSGEFRAGSGQQIGWSSSANPAGTAADTALARAAARVIGITDGGTLRSVPLTPAQISANQNDYAPGVARYYRLSSDAARTVTGLSVSQVDGQECEAWNVGSFGLTLAHQSGSSAAANRFITDDGRDTILEPSERAELRYDSTVSRWRVSVIQRKQPGELYLPWWETPAGTIPLNRGMRRKLYLRRLSLQLDTGTLTVTVRLNGVAVPGWDAVGATTALQDIAPTSGPIIADAVGGANLTVTVSGSGTGLTLGLSE